jgi:hypothetical protein
MDEILQKLLSSELLSEDAKTEISSKWSNAVNQYKQTIKEEVSGEVRTELAEMWTKEKEALTEQIDSFVTSKLIEEIDELKGDIESFRDLEAEFAKKVVEEKHVMAEQLSSELDELVDKMDAFFEMRLQEEFQELREDLEVVKQNEFGRKIFEAFANEFGKSHHDEDSAQAKLSAAIAKLKDAEKTIGALEESKAAVVREAKMEKILAPLNGRKREQMAFVLQNVDTDRLEEAYSNFIGRILKEDDSKDTVPGRKSVMTPLKESKAVLYTGDNSDKSKQAPAAKDDQLAHLRKLAGMSPR